MRQSNRQSVLLADVFEKPVVARFDAEALSSDGGLVLLGAIDRRWGLTQALCDLVQDARQGGKVAHGLLDLFRQRVYGIAAGYADGNDAGTLRSDVVFKMICGRDPIDGDDLASQPTLSRFERSFDARTLIRMERTFAEEAVRRLAERYPKARRVVIDLDATEDETHGQQTFSFFNAFYDSHCFLPLLGFLSVDDEPDQYLFHARLRPGVGAPVRDVIPTIRRVVALLRERLPGARILVRMDGGFANPLLLHVLEELRVQYVLGVQGNVLLIRKSKRFLRGLRRDAKRTGKSRRRYGSFSYEARSWSRSRRIVVKAEMLIPPPNAPRRRMKANLRFVVTNLPQTAKHVYERVYCARGDSENRIKELKDDLQIGRTSCSSYLANQLRVLMTATAYALYQEARWHLRGTDLRAAQVGTIRLALVKVAVRLVRSVRRIVLHLPRACPRAQSWCALARAASAPPG
jgi:hypothetical protein